MIRAPEEAEKALRSFLRQRALTLSRITLPEAWAAMVEFRCAVHFSGLFEPEGDGLVAYEDVTDHGRGMRLELGIVRLLRPEPATQQGLRNPALRLRLRLCFKWDMDVMSDVLPAGTWSYSCWAQEALGPFEQQVMATAAWRTMAGKRPAEAAITLEPASYPRGSHLQPADVRQMWYGVVDVR